MNHDLWIIFIAMVVTRAWVYIRTYYKVPSQWKCSVCTFRINSNDKEVVLRARKDHMSRHLEIEP